MKRKILSIIASLLIVVCFVGFTAVAMVLTVISPKETASYYENRNLAVFPQIEKETVFDGSYFSNIDKYISDHAVGRKAILAVKTAIDTYILKCPVVNGVVIGDDLLLPYNDYETVDTEKITQNAETIAQNLKRHSEAAESYGGKFYYIAVPCQYVCYEDKYPWYLNNRHDFTKVSSAELFELLDKNNISYIDMMEYYIQNEKPEEFTSTVDNHFSIFGAFDTYSELMKRILSDTDTKPDVFEKEDFDVAKQDYPYLGSRTRKLFGLWNSDERLYTMTPEKEIPIEMWNYGVKQESPAVYPSAVDPKGRVSYNLYMGGDVSETVIRTNRPELPSIFIYGDSFTNAVECVTWPSFDTMWSVDYRHYKGLGVDAFIEKHKPDIVVCIRDYEAMLTSDANGQ